MRCTETCCVASSVFAALILLQTLSHATTPFPESGGVRQNCAVCHRLDPEGRMEVIEETRKSTEEWIHVVDRMIRLNGAHIDDKDFYPIIKELCTHLMLTPAEMTEVRERLRNHSPR